MASVIAGAMGNAAAANFDYRAEVGLGHSDNIARTSENETSEEIARAGVRFSLDQNSSRLFADVVGAVAYNEYLDGTYDSEVVGNLLGNARFGIIPGRFDWALSDSFGQVLGDAFAPATPDNRENINYLSTGPDFTVPLTQQTQVRLSGRYLLTTYEDSPLDSSGMAADLALVRLLSAASQVSLNARHQEITYDESALDSDYTQRDAFLAYDVMGARTHLSIDAGYSALDREAAVDKEDGWLLRINASRRVSPSSRLSVAVGHEFESAGGAFAIAQGGVGVDVGAAAGRQASQPFTNDYARLGWDLSRNRTSLGIAVGRNEQSYEGSPQLDQTLTSANVALHRQLSPRTDLTIGAVYAAGNFKIANADYAETGGQIIFDWHLSRTLGVQLRYDRFDRNSDAPAGDYQENRFWLAMTYGRGRPRSNYLPPVFGLDADPASPATTP